MNKYLFIIACFFLSAMGGLAQTNDLTGEQLKEFQGRTLQLIKLFEKNISRLGSKNVKASLKPRIQRTTLQLFIQAGEPYIDFSGMPNTGVKMQVSNVRNGACVERLLKTYLSNLQKLRYARVEITSAETCKISNFYKIDDGLYEAVATIAQKFVGYNEAGIPVYIDLTHKSIKVQLRRVTLDGEAHWDAVLGDIDVLETRRT